MHHQVPRPTTYRMNSRSPGSDTGEDNDDDLMVEDYPGPNGGGGGGGVGVGGGYHDDDMTIMVRSAVGLSFCCRLASVLTSPFPLLPYM